MSALLPSSSDLIRELTDARAHTLRMIEHLEPPLLIGEPHPLANPVLWELGHVAWFQERWCLRALRDRPPLRADGDALWDSSNVPFATRYHLPLPDLAATRGYLAGVLERVLELLEAQPVDERVAYFHRLALYHEDMHGEALALYLQLRGWPSPPAWREPVVAQGRPHPGFVAFEGGAFRLGAELGRESFVFDNECWAHEVTLAPFELARAPVTNSEFEAFVEGGGYQRRELWTEQGWRWREAVSAIAPGYWRKQEGRWCWRRFDRLEPLPPHHPVIHVSWYEADAYARWAGARLPTEAEWELAASGAEKRRFPWGAAAPAPARANLDGAVGGTTPVDAMEEGDTPDGLRQMLGNVWEWTGSDFRPYPGFAPGPYADYSEPWFFDHKVLRGGAWTTRGRMLRNTWRNFYRPERRDPFAGFRLARS